MAQTIPPVKGTRDFYPEDYAPVQWILDAWRRVSLRHGFDEFEGPTLEHTELYTRKSGEEIVEQLFTMTDRGGRSLAMRPEMTPTLARMVAARQGSLPRPIKWFCMPRMYRGERPQRGRLREFYQWNVDILGVSGVMADAECILVAVDGLRELGLTADDFAIHISDRRLVAEILTAIGIGPDQHPAAYAILDKASKMPIEELSRRWGEAFAGVVSFDKLWEALSAPDVPEMMNRLRVIAPNLGELEAAAGLATLMGALTSLNIIEYCKLDLQVVRGLAYYTGVVFEAYDRRRELRAICGGGRYDDLLAMVGGKPLTGLGFGMGDVVLFELLTELKRVPALAASGGVFVVDVAASAPGGSSGGAASDESLPSSELLRIVASLRRAGYRAEFSYQRQAVGKQMARASEKKAGHVIFVSDKTREHATVELKDMAAGAQRDVNVVDLLARPADFLGSPKC